MAEENKIEQPEVTPGEKTRRTFVKTAAQVAVTAPAVAVLLNASITPASAQVPYGPAQSHILDDFTYGNDQEDIDAKKGTTDFTNFGGSHESQDDVGTPGDKIIP